MQEQAAKNRMKDFTIAKARPLPVIVLADASGSMSENGKIEALNHALNDMIKTFATASRVKAEIQVGLITRPAVMAGAQSLPGTLGIVLFGAPGLALEDFSATMNMVAALVDEAPLTRIMTL